MCCIDGEVRLVAEIARHPGCGLTAVIRGDPTDHYLSDALGSQPDIQIRGAVEARVHGFAHQKIRSASEKVLELPSGASFCQWRLKVLRLVPDEHQWPRLVFSVIDERFDVGLARWVVPWPPEIGVLKALLDVDDDQRRPGEVSCGGGHGLIVTRCPITPVLPWRHAQSD